MDVLTRTTVIGAYKSGHSARKIAELLGYAYARETVRKELRKAGVAMRGRNAQYARIEEMSPADAERCAELLGYLYGDGCVSKNKNSSYGLYDCKLVFAADELDLVSRVSAITRKLFGFSPKIKARDGYFVLKFLRSFAKHIAAMGYPVGKKSVLNPYLPFALLQTDSAKRGFLRGFFNAEASVGKTLSVQQSVRQQVPARVVRGLKAGAKVSVIGKNACWFIRWRSCKDLLGKYQSQSNVLTGVQTLLQEVGISSVIYPVRVYVGKNDIVSIHYELCVPPKAIKRALSLSLISCAKKVTRLRALLRQ